MYGASVAISVNEFRCDEFVPAVVAGFAQVVLWPKLALDVAENRPRRPVVFLRLTHAALHAPVFGTGLR